MRDISISDSILYVGADDKTLDIFESQYPIPNGVSYNSYVIMDEKVTVMDTVDKRATDVWFANLAAVLGDRKPAYLVVSHMEPDHAANIKNFADRYLKPWCTYPAVFHGADGALAGGYGNV